ncbi:MAG TPA: cytochrome c [Pyrinomonadaceae bacterium]|nr:cytochrome c [Pyrinomonadaceae bacterium]
MAGLRRSLSHIPRATPLARSPGAVSIKILCACVLALASALISSCKREERGFRVDPPSASRINTKRISDLQPGTPVSHAQVKNEYEENGPAISDGKRLYEWFNCVGCHAHGGGGMGPPLIDDQWIYGSEPDQIFATIVEGRPNGMPSFRDKIPDYQVWQLAAYVRSLSGQVPKDAASGRDDDMSTKKPEQQTETKQPKDSTLPKSAEMPK